MILDKKDSSFNPQIDVVGCFIEHDGKIILLKRANDKNYANKWSCPGGKKEYGETDVQTAVREIFEETGIKINPKNVQLIEKSHVRYGDFDFTYTFHKYVLNSNEYKDKPKIILSNSEHTNYIWITPLDALDLDLMEDEDYCIKKAYNIE